MASPRVEVHPQGLKYIPPGRSTSPRNNVTFDEPSGNIRPLRAKAASSHIHNKTPMKEGKQKVAVNHGDSKNNKRPRERKRNSADNNDQHNELLKYKQSFYIIRKTINLIKNHYSNKINKADSLRERERKYLAHLKRENVILEDKCTFYAEHVEELKKIYTEQIKLKNSKIENLQDELDQMRKATESEVESNSTRILKLREDQIERLSQQLDSINGLYHKQVDSNKKLMKEIEELNKSILYLNNKIQEEKNNRDNVRRRLKYYKRYTKNKKRFKLNFDVLIDDEESARREEEGDICAFTENSDVKFESRKVLSAPVKNLKKKTDGCSGLHREMRESIQKGEAKGDAGGRSDIGRGDRHGRLNGRHGAEPKKGHNWNALTLNDIYFYSNFDDNFDDKCDYFDQDAPSSGRPSGGVKQRERSDAIGVKQSERSDGGGGKQNERSDRGEVKHSVPISDGAVKQSDRSDRGGTSHQAADGDPPRKASPTVENPPAEL
ncbi:hypothetical protein PVMG_03538 [Plasmodium vivax Mauritania I]|uniref:Uncharacterized protein n=1 Tax=Plasmodium vivax Mauritania I TaxID=1035515 RepID=A0A0J9T5N7_PLAVI|nr:hypothetical protein PVMG_03538 [Plasmodium vivax Mauritania I]